MIFNKEELQELVNEKGIKSSEDFNIFMKEVTKKVIEALYEGEITHHLGHGKHQKSETGNIRNGYSNKTVRSTAGEIPLDVPRDRERVFEPLVDRYPRVYPGVSIKCRLHDMQSAFKKDEYE